MPTERATETIDELRVKYDALREAAFTLAEEVGAIVAFDSDESLQAKVALVRDLTAK